MTTRVITLAHKCNAIDNVRVDNAFSSGNIVQFEGDKINFKESYDKQNLSLVVISYEIYETRRRLVSYISYEMMIRVRSSI